MDAICSGSSRKRSTPPLDDRQKTEQLILLLTQHQDDPQILEMASKMFDVLQANIPNINDINPLQVDEMQVDEFAPLDILETFPPILFAEKKNEDDFCLKNHQTEAISFLYKKVIGPLEAWKEQHSGSGAIIAHFMGLGKTTTIVAFLYGILSHPAFEKRIKRVLIVAPYIVIPHWVKEFDKAEWKSSFGEKIAKIKATTLETAPSKMNDSSRLQRMQLTSWYNNEENNKIMVKKTKFVTKRRIILTGTPMQNNLKELHAVVNYVDKTILGPFEEFDLR
uniref:Helicase ATP-binding domain-containing protein n=1 Tax=Panagrolaimus superbus TaxID=310955 RepID=A0A914Y3L8_9BILA